MSLGLDDRYSQQILFDGIGRAGQERLSAARVAVVGCGATGSSIAALLGRSGVGTIRIIDRDYVEPSNLQRQTLFDESDAKESLPKAIAAARRISAFNSQIAVEPRVADLVPANIEELLDASDLILDGTDNFETRYLVNDYAVSKSFLGSYAAAVGSYAATLNVLPGETACLACVFPQSPRGTVETSETAGILNSAVNLVGSIAASEAIKLLVGAKKKCDGRFSRGMSGLTSEPKFLPAGPGAIASVAGSGTSSTWRARVGPILRSADETLCKYTNARGRSISPNFASASNRTARCGTTTSFSSSGRAL